MKHYIAFDQYGNTFRSLIHPRKDLLERLGYKHADKMYIDKGDGTSQHIGYVIGSHWIEVYCLLPFHFHQ